ncbi:MAG: hypothetical protein N2323_06185 [candidate division WOR-3 bacterium]|nr:hypothetical protein [candidate division WOR-3 bacterium]MCX7837521.1 hypothetical protein [candidate division WOR-3 bacterium]MDW8113833.1 hypothetical protein [candidate division WOR-3 bacterium]
MLNFLIFLIFTIYNEKLWTNYLAVDTVLTITGNERIVYVGTSYGILLFDAQKIRYLKTLTKFDGILESLKFVAYDREINSLWLLDKNFLMNYNPFTKKKELFKLNITPKAIGVGKHFLYFIANGDTYQWDKKKKRLLKIEKTKDTTIFWYGEKKKYLPQNFPFLTPYYYMDENLEKYFYKELFLTNRNLWVSANGYGILVFDRITKNLIKIFPFNNRLGKIRKILKFENNLWLIGERCFVKTDSEISKWRFFSLEYNKFYEEKEPLLKYKFLEIFLKKGFSSFANLKNSFAFVSEKNIYLFLEDYKEPIELEVPFEIENLYFLKDTLIILTKEGIYFFDYKNNILSDFSRQPPEAKFGVFSFLPMKEEYYFGVRGGFLIYKNQRWEKVIIPIRDLSIPIRELTNFDNYLITKIDNQIIFFDTKKRFFQFLTKEDGLIGEDIYSIKVDNNKLWISHEKGISLYDLTFLKKKIKK